MRERGVKESKAGRICGTEVFTSCFNHVHLDLFDGCRFMGELIEFVCPTCDRREEIDDCNVWLQEFIAVTQPRRDSPGTVSWRDRALNYLRGKLTVPGESRRGDRKSTRLNSSHL